MSSQQRRLEHYRIIYIWKILEGLVPNCGLESYTNERLGRLCILPKIKNCSRCIQTLRENSFKIHGSKLFYMLPKDIGNLQNCEIEDFKTRLDNFLSLIPDQPNIPGSQYTPGAMDQFTGKPSNSLTGQIRKYNLDIPQKERRRNPGK